jgi:hypothetical protein
METALYPRQRSRKESGPKPVGLVTCPNCRVVMARVSLKGSEDPALYEAAFHCPKCAAQTRRWIKL